jgi:hypothetical protein
MGNGRGGGGERIRLRLFNASLSRFMPAFVPASCGARVSGGALRAGEHLALAARVQVCQVPAHFVGLRQLRSKRAEAPQRGASLGAGCATAAGGGASCAENHWRGGRRWCEGAGAWGRGGRGARPRDVGVVVRCGLAAAQDVVHLCSKTAQVTRAAGREA